MRPFTLALALSLVLALSARACPNCKFAVPATSGADVVDQEREAAAYNVSIYIMVAGPYLLVGTVGFFIYRALNQRPAEAAPLSDPADGPGGSRCPSPDADSSQSPPQ